MGLAPSYTEGSRRDCVPVNWTMTPLLVTPTELATLLGLAPRTIYNRLNTGGDLPPVVRLGRLPRFFFKDVEPWLEKKHQPAVRVDANQPPPRRRPGRPTKVEQIARRSQGQ
jgi:predicted DNA-binding transcriptional regulator AlpA